LKTFKRPRAEREAGFTLLEVMVAFTIAALATLVLYRAAFNGAAERVSAMQYQQALLRAQSRLASIGTLTKLQPLQAEGDDGGGFSWQLRIAPVETDGQVTLYAIKVSENFGARSLSLSTLRTASAR
jgi:general secretion pathway protein I